MLSPGPAVQGVNDIDTDHDGYYTCAANARVWQLLQQDVKVNFVQWCMRWHGRCAVPVHTMIIMMIIIAIEQLSMRKAMRWP